MRSKAVEKPLKRIAVTGGGGQIAYNLLFRIASGEMLGKDQPLALHIVELPGKVDMLKGVVMELEDCGFPLLREVKIGSDLEEMFEGVNLILCVGAKPRGAGMERGDLLKENGRIFVEQGKAINRVAARGVRVFVVGNPCNTNCMIAMHHAPNVDRSHFFAMTQLDHTRARVQLALKAEVPVSAVERMTIWGNHSPTQVPDFFHATIYGRAVSEVILDQDWLRGEFMKVVQQRGTAVIAARGMSSAASAANAVIDGVKEIYGPTPQGRWFSSGVCSDRNPYGIQEGLIFSFPCATSPSGEHTIVKGLEWNEFLRNRILATERELIEERKMINDLLT